MSPLSWSFSRLALFWLAAASVGLVCWRIGQIRAPVPLQLSWLIPSDGASATFARTILVVCRDLFLQRPWEASAIIGIPALVLVVTLSWGISRLTG